MKGSRWKNDLRYGLQKSSGGVTRYRIFLGFGSIIIFLLLISEIIDKF